MTTCCQCGRSYWPGKGKCPGSHSSDDGCNHTPCENCQHYVDEKEKSYGTQMAKHKKKKKRKNR